MRSLILLIVFVFSFFGYAANEPVKLTGSLISMSVGKVGDHIATSREVHMSYLVEQALANKNKKKWAPQLLKETSKEFQKEVTSLLLEWTVYYEAKVFKTVQLTASETQEVQRILNAKLVRSTPWSWLKVTKSELNELIERKVTAKKFIRFKVSSSVVPITDREAEEYFQANRLKFGNMPFDKFKENIKSYLSREQMDRRLSDWFQVLQTKYNVRNYLSEI